MSLFVWLIWYFFSAGAQYEDNSEHWCHWNTWSKFLSSLTGIHHGWKFLYLCKLRPSCEDHTGSWPLRLCWCSVSLIPWDWLYFKWFLFWFLGFSRSVTFRRHWHSWQVLGQNVHILTWFVCLMWIAIFQIQPNFGEVNSQFYRLLMLVAQNHSL